jgi:AraC family transcriptional regulator, transcriptional activator of pobA
MVTELPVFTLINPQNGNLAFKFMVFNDGSSFDHVQRHNYYSLIWVKQGSGKVRADFKDYGLSPGTLFAFSPYQPFVFITQNIGGVALYFHPDFFCIHKHQAEIACNGVLFNNIYESPFIKVSDDSGVALDHVLTEIRNEIQNMTLAQHEILVSYLKIFLIHCSRLKTEQAPRARTDLAAVKEPFILQNLKDAIEKNFKTKHSAGEYANELNISVKALAKTTKTYFNKTITELISERIIIEAKRELYLTNKTVKEIAYGLGYDDEYYFSRFFKVNTDISPQMYRETVGFGRGAA